MKTTEYDLTPYDSKVLPQTLPEHLAGQARLFGLKVPDTRTMRVLELGCGEASNLLALACTHPDAQFVGVDLSLRQITQAREDRDKLGLTNVELFHGSIADINDSIGTFDFILCHGVYSWVPGEVRDHIRRVIRTRLRPDGLAYVSYNVLPGWAIRSTMRDMMLYHARQYEQPQDQVAQARALGNFLADALSATPDWEWTVAVKSEMARLGKLPDWYLFHDNLAENNHPHWFWEVARDFLADDLRYLGDTSIRTMIVEHFSPDIVAALADARDDQVRLEQYLDFLRCRGFRQSIFCHANREIDRHITAERLAGLRFVPSYEPQGEAVTVNDDSAATFKIFEGATITTSDRGMKAVLMAMLEQAPNALSLTELKDICRQYHTELSEDELAANVITMISRDALLARTWAPPTGTVAERPRVFGPARIAVQKGGSYLPNRRHVLVQCGPIDRVVIRLADGTRDHDALHAGLVGAVASGELQVTDGAGNLWTADAIAPKLRAELAASLNALAKLALLEP
jgi:methyltransferase-like protein